MKDISNFIPVSISKGGGVPTTSRQDGKKENERTNESDETNKAEDTTIKLQHIGISSNRSINLPSLLLQAPFRRTPPSTVVYSSVRGMAPVPAPGSRTIGNPSSAAHHQQDLAYKGHPVSSRLQILHQQQQRSSSSSAVALESIAQAKISLVQAGFAFTSAIFPQASSHPPCLGNTPSTSEKPGNDKTGRAEQVNNKSRKTRQKQPGKGVMNEQTEESEQKLLQELFSRKQGTSFPKHPTKGLITGGDNNTRAHESGTRPKNIEKYCEINGIIDSNDNKKSKPCVFDLTDSSSEGSCKHSSRRKEQNNIVDLRHVEQDRKNKKRRDPSKIKPSIIDLTTHSSSERNCKEREDQNNTVDLTYASSLESDDQQLCSRRENQNNNLGANQGAKKTTTVVVPPGKLGMFLTEKSDLKGAVVSSVDVSSVLSDKISPGDWVVAIDGEDVARTAFTNIIAIISRRTKYERRLTVLTAPHKNSGCGNLDLLLPKHESQSLPTSMIGNHGSNIRSCNYSNAFPENSLREGREVDNAKAAVQYKAKKKKVEGEMAATTKMEVKSNERKGAEIEGDAAAKPKAEAKAADEPKSMRKQEVAAKTKAEAKSALKHNGQRKRAEGNKVAKAKAEAEAKTAGERKLIGKKAEEVVVAKTKADAKAVGQRKAQRNRADGDAAVKVKTDDKATCERELIRKKTEEKMAAKTKAKAKAAGQCKAKRKRAEEETAVKAKSEAKAANEFKLIEKEAEEKVTAERKAEAKAVGQRKAKRKRIDGDVALKVKAKAKAAGGHKLMIKKGEEEVTARINAETNAAGESKSKKLKAKGLTAKPKTKAKATGERKLTKKKVEEEMASKKKGETNAAGESKTKKLKAKDATAKAKTKSKAEGKIKLKRETPQEKVTSKKKGKDNATGQHKLIREKADNKIKSHLIVLAASCRANAVDQHGCNTGGNKPDIHGENSKVIRNPILPIRDESFTNSATEMEASTASATSTVSGSIEVSSRRPTEVLGGCLSWPEGWIKKAYKRRGGKSAGQIDYYWCSPEKNYKFTSLNGVRPFMLGLQIYNGDEKIARSQMHYLKELLRRPNENKLGESLLNATDASSPSSSPTRLVTKNQIIAPPSARMVSKKTASGRKPLDTDPSRPPRQIEIDSRSSNTSTDIHESDLRVGNTVANCRPSKNNESMTVPTAPLFEKVAAELANGNGDPIAKTKKDFFASLTNREKRKATRSSSKKGSKFSSDWNLRVTCYYESSCTSSISTSRDNGSSNKANSIGLRRTNSFTRVHWSTKEDTIGTGSSMMGTLEKSYAIHQAIVASRSKYFERLMFGGYYSESHQNQSSMELPREFCESGVVSMKAFENFLDWCYWEKVELTPSNAIGVMCLSDYFCADDLKAEIEVYIEQFLQSCNFQQEQQQDDATVKSAGLAVLYRNAKITGLEHIQDAVANICARNPSYMSKEFKLTESLRDVDFWVAVFQSRASGRKLRSATESEESWSTYFADYIRDYPETVDAESFKFLTSKVFLPKLSNSAASCLMEQELRLLGTTGSSSIGRVVVLDRDPKNERVESPTCLQQRCIEALFEQGHCIKALYD